MDPTQRVCPDCGQAAGSQPFCAACGKNLSTVDRLPTREEWERGRPPPPITAAPDPASAAAAPAPTPATPPSPAAPAENLWAAPEPEAPRTPPDAQAPAVTPPPAEGAQPSAAPAPAPGPLRAHWGYRVGAWLVDAGAAIAIGLGIELLLEQSSSADTAESVGGLSILAAWVLLTAGVSARTGGQSLGKWIAGVRVVRDGHPAGFGRIFLRDTVCGLLYLVPLFFVVNACFPLGEERRSVIDRIVGTDVVETDRIKGRVPVLVVAAALAIGAWVGLAAARGGFAGDHYTRSEWVADCTDGGANAATCGCIYDRLEARMSQADVDQLQTADNADDIFPGAQHVIDDAADACR